MKSGSGDRASESSGTDAGRQGRTRESLRQLGRTLDLHGLCQSTLTQLTGGAFMTGYLLAFGAGSIMIGIAAAVPLAAKLSQLYISWRIEIQDHWRRIAIAGAFLGRLPWLLAAGLPLLGASGDAGAWQLVAVIAVTGLGASIWEIAHLTWMAALVPEGRRGVFWGKRSRVSEPFGLSVAMIASFFFDRWHSAHPGSFTGFEVIFTIAALAGLFGIVFLYRLPLPAHEIPVIPDASFSQTILRPVRNRNFRRLLTFVFLWGLVCALIGPFTAVFMLQQLKLSFLMVTIVSSVPTLLIALTQPYWGRMADHFGNKPVLSVAAYLVATSTIFWLGTAPGRIWPLILLQLVSGFGWSAYHIGVNNMALAIAPAESRSSYVAALGTFFAVSQAIAPIIGGSILSLLAGLGVPVLDTYYALFGISLLGQASATLLLRGVEEPGVAAVGHMIRVMGRFRSMGAAPWADLIFDYGYTNLAHVADFITGEQRDLRRPRRQRTGHRRRR